MKNKIIVLLLFCTLIFPIFTSCKQTEYVEVPVEVVKTEYKVKKDSVYLHDSINIFTEIKGDTVYVNKFKYKTLTSYKTDTVIKIDSIPVILEKTKIKEVNRTTLFQRILMYAGGVGILTLIIGIFYKFKLWKLLF